MSRTYALNPDSSQDLVRSCTSAKRKSREMLSLTAIITHDKNVIQYGRCDAARISKLLELSKRSTIGAKSSQSLFATAFLRSLSEESIETETIADRIVEQLRLASHAIDESLNDRAGRWGQIDDLMGENSPEAQARQGYNGTVRVMTKATETPTSVSGGIQAASDYKSHPLRGAYVKVYAELKSGNRETVFWKDGYMDLVGRFDYVTVSMGIRIPVLDINPIYHLAVWNWNLLQQRQSFQQYCQRQEQGWCRRCSVGWRSTRVLGIRFGIQFHDASLADVGAVVDEMRLRVACSDKLLGRIVAPHSIIGAVERVRGFRSINPVGESSVIAVGLECVRAGLVHADLGGNSADADGSADGSEKSLEHHGDS
ncbi:MAG: hypothetical protein J3Q66DRAFT_439019 [Benniella sp.]|nr:MAG: hypothetical protein J3Q66DRAFT_439019 [Benniella sp.]